MNSQSAPENLALDPKRIEELLRTRWLGRPLRVFNEIDSTNTRALNLGDSEAVHGLALLAENQTGGRGRFKRRWSAPGGKALLMSVVLRGARFGRAGSGLTMAAAVGVHRFLNRLFPGECEIRWPNDLLLRGKKACGILTEAGSWPVQNPGWVLGIGININQAETDFPPAMRETAISAAIAAGRAFDRNELFAQAALDLEEALDGITSGAEGKESIRKEWERSCVWMGRVIRVDTGAGIVEGTVIGADADGAIILRLPFGATRVLHSGTVLK